MLALKYLLMLIGLGLLGGAGALVVYDVYVAEQLRRLIKRKANGETGIEQSDPPPPFVPVRWRQALRLAAAAVLPVLLALSIVVIPDGSAGVRISQIWGARPGTLYPGVHLVTPLIDSVSLYDTREQVYQTLAVENDKKEGRGAGGAGAGRIEHRAGGVGALPAGSAAAAIRFTPTCRSRWASR